MLYRSRILGQGSYFLRQDPSEANLTLDDLKKTLQTNSYDSLMTRLMHYAKNVTGTNAYWSQARDNLKAIISQNGPPTMFWTLSCADSHWPEFYELFDGNSKLSDSERRENVINNPHLLDWLFTENLLNFGLKKVLVQHGIGLDMSMLFSGVQFTVKDQNLCELSQQAVRGYLAVKSMTETNLGKFAKADLLENQQFISKGLEAEKIICTMLIS